MNKAAIFIDGGYLSKVLKEDFSSQKINFGELSNLLAKGESILRTYYYNCLPYKPQKPTPDEVARYSNMQRFFEALKRIDRYEVREGKLEFRGYNSTHHPIFVQKRVDSLLACDLVLLSAKQRISKAIILTGDSDFIPAIAIAKNEGVEIEIVYGPTAQTHEQLYQIADLRTVLTAEDINKIKVE